MMLVKRGSGVWFHASPSRNRDSIRRHGLDWRRMTPPGIAGSRAAEWDGVFLCDSLEGAVWFAGMCREGTADVWSAEIAEVWLEGAPDSDGGGGSNWMICPQPITPNRLQLIETDVAGWR